MVTFASTTASPTITLQPSNQTACLGKGLQYEVVVDGAGLAYDWDFNDNDGKGWVSLSGFADLYPGYNTSTLTTNGTEKDGRQYRLKITNPCSTMYSQPASFTYQPNITITGQPTSVTACYSSGQGYSVSAIGTGLHYSWEFNDGGGWSILSGNEDQYIGLNSPQLITISQQPDGRQYRVRVYNGCGSVYSQTASFIRSRILISRQPSSQTACTSSRNGLQYSVAAADDSGSSSLRYMWEFNDGDGWNSLSRYADQYPGWETATLTTNGTEKDGRQYRVNITSCGAQTYSEPATFHLLPGIAITSQPPSASSVLAGTAVSVSVSVTGTVSAYQWYRDNMPVEGQTSASLSLSNVQTSQAGSYWLVAASACQSLTSTVFSLSVTGVVDLVPTLYLQPSTVYGQSPISVVVEVMELNGVTTNGMITLKITRDAKLTLELPTDATSVGGRLVNNRVWQLSQADANYYVLTTTAPIPAGDMLSVGLTGVFTPGSTAGEFMMGGELIYTAGEQRTSNNLDSETIEYFPQ